jgi:hypothetical protein
MSDDRDPDAPEELRRAQRRQIHTIGASAVSVVAATALGVHAWHGAPHTGGLSSADVAASSQPLTSMPASSQPPASASELAPDASLMPIGSPSPDASPSPSPSARPTASTIDSNGQVELKLTMTASPTRVEFGQPVRVTLTIVNAGQVYAHAGQLGVGTMRPTDTFNEVPRACDAPQPGGVWCSAGGFEPGQKKSYSFSITSTSAPFSDDLVHADLQYLDSHGQQHDKQVTAPELTVIDDPGNWPPPTSASPPTSAPPSTTPSTP